MSAQVSITFAGWQDNGTNGGYWGSGVAGSAIDRLEAHDESDDLSDVAFGGACGYFDIEELCPGMGLSGNIVAEATVYRIWSQMSWWEFAPAGDASTETKQIATLIIDYPTQTLATDTTGEITHSTVCNAGIPQEVDEDEAVYNLGCSGPLSSQFATAKAKLFLFERSEASATYYSEAVVWSCEDFVTSFTCHQ